MRRSPLPEPFYGTGGTTSNLWAYARDVTSPPAPDAAGSPAAQALWPLYAGGFLGPFGGAIVSTMLPELAAGLDTSIATASSALTWYMVPFAGLLVVSGTVGGRWGEARTVRWAYVLSVVGSLVCVVAGSVVPFLAGRVLQGAANAFTTPLLVAMITALAPPARLGRSLGTYASLSAAGQAFAPLVGGLAAGWDYRLAFGASALAAAVLAVVTPVPRATGAERGLASEAGRDRVGTGTSRWRPLRNSRLARIGVTALGMQFTATSLILLSALIASDRFGLTPTARGLVVATFGLAGLASGRVSGHLTDRFGLLRVGVSALALLAAAAIAATVAGWLGILVAATALAGVSSTAVRVLVQTLALRSTPANPSGALSIALAVQFGGTALAPALLPVYDASPTAAGLVAAAVSLAAALVIGVRPTSGAAPR